jgi:hypothetical protein
MDDNSQQQEDLQSLAIGNVLFGNDLDAIRRTLLPGLEVKLSRSSKRQAGPEVLSIRDLSVYIPRCDLADS